MKHFWIIILLLIFLISCTEEYKSFKEVSYSKVKENLQYYAFYLEGYEGVNNENFPQELEELMIKNADSLGESDGVTTTTVFYYIKPNQAPDISKLSKQEAYNLALDKWPIRLFSIGPIGHVRKKLNQRKPQNNFPLRSKLSGVTVVMCLRHQIIDRITG